MFSIRCAVTDEIFVLTEIAVRSEAYWGYDKEFMDNFRREYALSIEYIEKNPTYVLENEGDIIGFYSLMPAEDKAELEYLFIEPVYIGCGYGKLLWEHMITTCHELGIKRVELVTGPQVKGFYIKMGAELVGEVESLVRAGSMIPRLAYVLA